MAERGKVLVLDDDADLGASVARLLRRSGYDAEAYTDPEAMLGACAEEEVECLVSDVMLGRSRGFAVAEQVRAVDPAVSVVFMTAWPSTADAVDAVRGHSGLDYLEKPIDEARLLAALEEGVASSRRRRKALRRIATLTPRERDVFDLLVQGMSNKVVAAKLGLSPKTIEDHRKAIMTKTAADSLAELISISKSIGGSRARPR